MSRLLDIYDAPRARTAFLARFPEVLGAIDVCGALLMANDARVLTGAQRRKAARVAQGLRQGVGVIQDLGDDTLPVDQHLALLRAKKGIREAALICSWPYTTAGDGRWIALSAQGEAALDRLVAYDPVRDFGRPYNGSTAVLAAVLQDMRDVTSSFSLVDNGGG